MIERVPVRRSVTVASAPSLIVSPSSRSVSSPTKVTGML